MGLFLRSRDFATPLSTGASFFLEEENNMAERREKGSFRQLYESSAG